MDLALVNGTIYTMDPARPKAEAMVICGNRITFIGSQSAVESEMPQGCEEMDLRGRTLVPGFVDAHMHLMAYALSFERVDLSLATNLKDALALVVGKANGTAAGEWVAAVNFDETNWPEKKMPIKESLDAISTEKPILMRRICGHVAVGNSMALDLIGRELDGVNAKTGVILEEGSLKVNKVIKPKKSEMLSGMKKAMPAIHAHGVTAVGDITQRKHLEIFQEMRKARDLRVRVTSYVGEEQAMALADSGLRTGFGDDFLKLGGVKLFADGSIGAKTAALLEPYSDDPNNVGMLMYSDSELEKHIQRCNDAGLQMMIHAIGDRCVEQVIGAYSKVLKDTSNPLRHRIEHFEVLDTLHIQKAKRINLVASMQPNFVGNWSQPGGMNETRLGKERLQRCGAFRSINDAGITIAFGSDVMPFGPLYGIHSAAHHPIEKERISVEEALRMYTANSAFACHGEKSIGMLKKGMLADMVVLSHNPIKTSNIKDIMVDMTILDGEVVYERNPSQ